MYHKPKPNIIKQQNLGVSCDFMDDCATKQHELKHSNDLDRGFFFSFLIFRTVLNHREKV